MSIDKLLNQQVIALDEWYGVYLGICKGKRRSPAVNRMDVEIIRCLVQPSDRAILYPNAYVHRDAYPPGSIQHFDINNIQLAAESMRQAG